MDKFFQSIAKSKFLRTLGITDQPSFSQIDLYRASVALKGYNFVHSNANTTLTPQVLEDIHAELGKMNENQLNAFVHQSITQQVIELFNHLHKVNEAKSRKPRRRLDILEGRAEPEPAISPSWPFSLHCATSSLPNAGQGVFLTSSKPLLPGTVVAFYPGLVHLKEHLRDTNYLKSLLPDPDFLLMSRLDQSLIDGRTAHLTPAHPYALGHKINHCGTLPPNVMQVSFDFAEDFLQKTNAFPEETRYLIPNGYAKEPSLLGRLEVHNVVMKSVVFITTRIVGGQQGQGGGEKEKERREGVEGEIGEIGEESRGEELVMDYRLDPRKALPSWYLPYDKEDALLRWDAEQQEEEREQ